MSITTQYGSFDREADGRLSGHVLHVSGPRRDGKYTVQHHFGSGKRINKLYTREQLLAEIAKIEADESNLNGRAT